jgi:hypothetical protein
MNPAGDDEYVDDRHALETERVGGVQHEVRRDDSGRDCADPCRERDRDDRRARRRLHTLRAA